jgi:hypothetical protein
MKLEFQNRWLRLLIEFLPASPAIRRYRAMPARLDAEIGRLLQRQISRQLRRPSSEETA